MMRELKVSLCVVVLSGLAACSAADPGADMDDSSHRRTQAPVPKLPPARFTCGGLDPDPAKAITYVETTTLSDVGQTTIMPGDNNYTVFSSFKKDGANITSVVCKYSIRCLYSGSRGYEGDCDAPKYSYPTTVGDSNLPDGVQGSVTLEWPRANDDAEVIDPNRQFFQGADGFDLKDYCRVMMNHVVDRSAVTGPSDEARKWCPTYKDVRLPASCCVNPPPTPVPPLMPGDGDAPVPDATPTPWTDAF